MRADRAVFPCVVAALTLSGCMQRHGPIAFARRYATATSQPAALAQHAALTYSSPPGDAVDIAERWF